MRGILVGLAAVATLATAAVVADQKKLVPNSISGLRFTVFVLLMMGFCIFFWRSVRKNRAVLEAARRSAQSAAITDQTKAADLIRLAGSEEVQAPLASCVSTYGGVGDDGRALIQTYGAMQRRLSDAQEAYTRLRDEQSGPDGITGGPHDPTLAVNAYLRLSLGYRAARQDVLRALEKAEEVKRLAEAIKSRREALAQRIEDEAANLAKARQIVAALRGDGYNAVEMEALERSLDGAAANLAQAEALGATSEALLAEAATDCRDVICRARILQDLRERVIDNLGEVDGEIAETLEMVPEALRSFRRLRDESPPLVWESIRGNGSEAGNRLRRAIALVDEAGVHADMDHQEWEDAEMALAKAQDHVYDARDLLEAILALQASVAETHEQAERELARARADLDKAAEYAVVNGGTNDHWNDRLTEARSLLGEAQKQAEVETPDWQQVVTLALTANHLVDSILADCMEESETLRRQHHLAAQLIRLAEQIVAEAGSFVDSHNDDIEEGVIEQLEDALYLLEAARKAARSGKPQETLELATRSKSAAEAALGAAKRCFQDAETQHSSKQPDRSPWGTSQADTGSDIGQDDRDSGF